MRVGLILTSILLAVVGCGTPEPLEVKQFTLRTTATEYNKDALIRAERLKRLYGAVSQKQRADRLGHYYTARYRTNPAGGEVELRFDYRQSLTGSRLQSTRLVLPPKREGVAEFQVTGENYRKGGRVTMWRLQLIQDGLLLDEQQSYLWE